MTHTTDTQQNCPNDPSCPAKQSQRNQRENCEPRNRAMRAWRDRKDDVTAVELSPGQQVQRCRKHSYPRGNSNGMQVNPAHWNIRDRTCAANDNQQFANEMKNQRVSEINTRNCLT